MGIGIKTVKSYEGYLECPINGRGSNTLFSVAGFSCIALHARPRQR